MVLFSYPAFLEITIFNRKSSYQEGVIFLRIFKLYLPFELFDRIKLMTKFYNLSISKMMKELLEIGYIEMLKDHNYKDNDQEVIV